MLLLSYNLIKQMDNNKSGSYQKFRSLYQQKFMKEGWQPAIQHNHNVIKYKNLSDCTKQMRLMGLLPDQKYLQNSLARYEKALSHRASQIQLKKNKSDRKNKQIKMQMHRLYCRQVEPQAINVQADRPPTNTTQMQLQNGAMACKYVETPKTCFWLKQSKLNQSQRKLAFSGERKKRKLLIKNLNTISHTNRTGNIVQFKQVPYGLPSKKSTLIQMIEEIKRLNHKKNKQKSRLNSKQQKNVSVDSKNSVKSRDKQKIKSVALFRDQKFRHYIKQNKVHSKSSRQTRTDKTYIPEIEPKIDPWNVVQFQY